MLARNRNDCPPQEGVTPAQDGMIFTPTLAERYPMVKEIIVRANFSEPNRIPSLDSQKYIFKPEAPAYFEIPCPSNDCLGGSFNLDFVIASMLFHRIAKGEGNLHDKGGQRSYLANQHLCLLEMHYTITIHYAKGYEAQPYSQASFSLSTA